MASPMWQRRACVSCDQREFQPFKNHGRSRRPHVQQDSGKFRDFGKCRQCARHVCRGHRKGFKTCKSQIAGRIALQPSLPRRKQVQPGAKPKFADVKPFGEPSGQIIAIQEHVPGLGQTAIERVIRIIELARYRDHPVFPI